MQLTKTQLKKLILEEIQNTLLIEAEAQKYIDLDNKELGPFKYVPKFQLGAMKIACGEYQCRMLGRLDAEKYKQEFARHKAGRIVPYVPK